MGIEVVDLRPLPVSPKPPAKKVHYFFFTFITLIKKLFHQQNTCFRSSKSLRKDIRNLFNMCACTTTNKLPSFCIAQPTLGVDGMTLTGNQPKKCYVSCHVIGRIGADRSHRINTRRFYE